MFSARYDNRLIFGELVNELKGRRKLEFTNIIKRGGGYMRLSVDGLVFRDFCNMLPAGTSLDQVLASQGFEGAKMAFPWDWFTSMDKVGVGWH